jgi:hypothetical protein
MSIAETKLELQNLHLIHRAVGGTLPCLVKHLGILVDDSRQTVGFLLELMDGGSLDDAIRYEDMTT